jgi:D-serine deaminase-like pyridoxal phosphate-dependent protein
MAAGPNAALVGELVTLMAPHCDPTVKVHDWFPVMRDGGLVDLWPIDARGY